MHELDDPLRELVERLRRLEVEEAEQVDEQERARGRRAGPPPSAAAPRRARPIRSSANATRKPSARMSARTTVPATFQCTFSKVTQKSVAKKKKSTTPAAVAAVARGACRSLRRCASPISEQLGELLDARLARERSRTPAVRARAVSVPARQRRASAASASRERRRTSSGGATIPAPVSRISVGGGAVRRHRGEDRPLGREVLEDLAREDAPAAPAGLRDQQQQRLRVALQLERARGAARTASSSSRSPRPRLSAHSRSAARKSPTKRATTSSPSCCERGQERSRVALAEEAARCA